MAHARYFPSTRHVQSAFLRKEITATPAGFICPLVLLSKCPTAPEPDTYYPGPETTPAKPRHPRIAPGLTRIEFLHGIDNKTCSYCSYPLHRMGDQVSELEFIPAEICVIKQGRPKYSCHTCEREKTSASIHIADEPPPSFPNAWQRQAC